MGDARFTLVRAFQKVDGNGSGKISYDEFNEHCRRLAVATDNEMEGLLNILDPDNMGSVDYRHFAAFVMGVELSKLPTDVYQRDIAAMKLAQNRRTKKMKEKMPPPRSKAEAWLRQKIWVSTHGMSSDHDRRHMKLTAELMGYDEDSRNLVLSLQDRHGVLTSHQAAAFGNKRNLGGFIGKHEVSAHLYLYMYVCVCVCVCVLWGLCIESF